MFHTPDTTESTMPPPRAPSMPLRVVSRAILYGKNVQYGEDVLTILGLRQNVGMANGIAAYV